MTSLLNYEELQQFALHLKSYREGVSVGQFCEHLMELYGEKRKYLLPGRD